LRAASTEKTGKLEKTSRDHDFRRRCGADGDRSHGNDPQGVLRLIPFLFVLYVFNYLDRINIGFATLSMKKALGLIVTRPFERA
jgi:hypothetical protein